MTREDQELTQLVRLLLSNQIQFKLENDGEAQSYLWLTDKTLIMNNSDYLLDIYYHGLLIARDITAKQAIIKIDEFESNQDRTNRLRILTETHGM